MNQPNKQKNGFWKNILGVYVSVALIALSFFAGSQVGYIRGQKVAVPSGEGRVINFDVDPPADLSRDVDFGLYWRVWNLLKERYVERPVSDVGLFYGSLKGMVESLGDPYTVFFDPETNRQFREELAGRFEGIGAEIGMKESALTIIAPLPDTPADQAGLKAGDRILAIDGKDATSYTVEYAVSKIRGQKDTNVVLSIFRDGFDGPRDFTITRDEIKIKSVRTEFRDDGIVVLHIYQFGDDTTVDFENAVQEILTRNPRGIILDLRNNPGGYLDSAVAVAGEWVPEFQVVVVEQNETRTEFRSEGPTRLEDMQTVVLVNGGSASASEILSGALQDYQIAKIIGTKTFGKGSVQGFEPLQDGSALKYTIAEWLTPLGHSINKVGITPDEIVEFTEADAVAGRDPQLARALELMGQ